MDVGQLYFFEVDDWIEGAQTEDWTYAFACLLRVTLI